MKKNVFKSFTHKMAAKTSWHRCVSLCIIMLFCCAERAADIRGRSVRGNRGGKLGRHTVDSDIEVRQTIANEVLHNASGDSRFVHVTFVFNSKSFFV